MSTVGAFSIDQVGSPCTLTRKVCSKGVPCIVDGACRPCMCSNPCNVLSEDHISTRVGVLWAGEPRSVLGKHETE